MRALAGGSRCRRYWEAAFSGASRTFPDRSDAKKSLLKSLIWLPRRNALLQFPQEER